VNCKSFQSEQDKNYSQMFSAEDYFLIAFLATFLQLIKQDVELYPAVFSSFHIQLLTVKAKVVYTRLWSPL